MTNFTNNDVASGAIVYASDHNTQGALLAAVLNGGIDNNNLSASAAIAGSKLADSAITKTKVDWSTSGGIWWEELGRTTLGSTADTITVSSLTAKKYLKVIVHILNSGQVSPVVRFNNDSGTNYTRRISSDGGADSTATGATNGLSVPAVSGMVFLEFDVANIATSNKGIRNGTSIRYGGGAPNRDVHAGMWSNSTDAITRVDIVNAGTGDFAANSEVIVLGHD